MGHSIRRRLDLRSVGAFTGWVVISYLATMLLWVLVPLLLLGWRPMVVVSDSMAPLIRAGDVVHLDPDGIPDTPGEVVGFDIGDGPVVHRLVEITDAGELVTRGDANARRDSTPVESDHVLGRGRLLVPYIGMAKILGLWWWAGLVAVLFLVAPSWKSGLGGTAVVAVALTAVAGAVGALALFTAGTVAGGSFSILSVEPATGVNATCPGGLLGSIPVTLTWEPSTTSGVTGYRILYDPPGGGTDYTEVGAVDSAIHEFEHTLSGGLLALGESHRYVVVAQRGAWVSGLSAADDVRATSALGLLYVCTS